MPTVVDGWDQPTAAIVAELAEGMFPLADWVAAKIAASGYKPHGPQTFYNVAETLLAVSGDRGAVNASVTGSPWYHEFQNLDHKRHRTRLRPPGPISRGWL